jgi:hypothetical protein
MTRLDHSVRDGLVRIRSAGNTKRKTGLVTTGQLSVPAHIRRSVPADSVFRAELTDDGILYRFVDCRPETDSIPVEERPAWARETNE